MEKDPDLKKYLAKRDALFRNPTLEAAQNWWIENENPQWNHPSVPLAAVHKARLQWLDATDRMIVESLTWLNMNGYKTSFKDIEPLTPEQRDADRVTLGKKPLKEH